MIIESNIFGKKTEKEKVFVNNFFFVAKKKEIEIFNDDVDDEANFEKWKDQNEERRNVIRVDQQQQQPKQNKEEINFFFESRKNFHQQEKDWQACHSHNTWNDNTNINKQNDWITFLLIFGVSGEEKRRRRTKIQNDRQ